MKAFNSILTALVILFAGLPVSATSAPDGVALEAEAARIDTMLMSPCCWRQPVSEHQSDISKEMKASIRQMLAEGKEHQEILDHYVELYGARILSIPPQSGFNRMSFVMPAMFGAIGLIGVFLVLRNWRHFSARAATPVNQDMSRRIQEELEKY